MGTVKAARQAWRWSLDIVALFVALVLTAGSDDSGRQADVYAATQEETGQPVVRGSFYAWFTDALAAMLKDLLDHAMETVWEQPPLLTGRLAKVGVKDWIVVDSETVTLPDELADIFPASSMPAGLKVHSYYSLGRNNVVDIEITPASGSASTGSRSWTICSTWPARTSTAAPSTSMWPSAEASAG